jgi:hypothetical protein
MVVCLGLLPSMLSVHSSHNRIQRLACKIDCSSMQDTMCKNPSTFSAVSLYVGIWIKEFYVHIIFCSSNRLIYSGQVLLLRTLVSFVDGMELLYCLKKLTETAKLFRFVPKINDYNRRMCLTKDYSCLSIFMASSFITLCHGGKEASNLRSGWPRPMGPCLSLRVEYIRVSPYSGEAGPISAMGCLAQRHNPRQMPRHPQCASNEDTPGGPDRPLRQGAQVVRVEL